MERFLLVTLGSLEGRSFPIVDTADTYHRVKCYATSWAEGTQLVEYLNRGSADATYWDQTAADLKSVERRGYRPLGDDSPLDQLRRELDGEQT